MTKAAQRDTIKLINAIKHNSATQNATYASQAHHRTWLDQSDHTMRSTREIDF